MIDTVALILATMRALVVSGGAAFADPAWAGRRRRGRRDGAWTSRISTETHAPARAAAVGRKESMAPQRSRRASTGRRRCPPPDAGRVARALYTASSRMDGARAMAESGSGRFFRRAQLLCSLTDWTLLLSAWQAAVSGATPPAAVALPLAAFFALDLTDWRAAVALAASHGCSSEENVRKGETSRHGDQDPRSTITRQVSPAGMTTRLTQSLYTLNVFNASLAAVLFLFFGSNGMLRRSPPSQGRRD